jgi:hypothetical protein
LVAVPILIAATVTTAAITVIPPATAATLSATALTV